MELWFIYTLASTVFAGLHTFIQKVAVEGGHSSALINTWSTVVSSLLALLVSAVFFGFDGAWKLGILLGVANGLTHMTGSILRMDALKHIDTAIFFPLYKTAGPIFALLLGIFMFSESFSLLEWVGIAFGITVPLLLLHREEKSRQNNLQFGVLLMLGSAFFTAIAAAISKFGADIFSSIFLFVAVSHGFGALSGWGVHYWQNRNNTTTIIPQTSKVYIIAILAGIMQFAGFSLMMLAFSGGTLAVVYTINSFYILIPIVLSVWWYKEHFSVRKGAAIALSILALFFLQ